MSFYLLPTIGFVTETMISVDNFEMPSLDHM